MFTILREGLAKLQKEQHTMKINHFGLKERIDLSCVKLDLVNENVAISGTNVLKNQWAIKELQVLVTQFTEILINALKEVDDANKGEENRSCKSQGRGNKDGRKDDDGNDGQRRSQRLHSQSNPREKFLALSPPESSSWSKHRDPHRQ
nr:glutamic acid-rich protein-like [Ipomoea batatas]